MVPIPIGQNIVFVCILCIINQRYVTEILRTYFENLNNLSPFIFNYTITTSIFKSTYTLFIQV